MGLALYLSAQKGVQLRPIVGCRPTRQHGIRKTPDFNRSNPQQQWQFTAFKRNAMAEHGKNADVDVLVGWKEIANYLQKVADAKI